MGSVKALQVGDTQVPGIVQADPGRLGQSFGLLGPDGLALAPVIEGDDEVGTTVLDGQHRFGRVEPAIEPHKDPRHLQRPQPLNLLSDEGRRAFLAVLGSLAELTANAESILSGVGHDRAEPIASLIGAADALLQGLAVVLGGGVDVQGYVPRP